MVDSNFIIPSVSPRIQYVTTPGQLDFVVPFRFFQDEDIELYKNTSDTPESSALYTLAGAGTNANGTLSLTVAFPTGTLVTLVRNSAIERLVNFQDSGDWTAQNVNDQLNRLVTFIQEVALKAVDLAVTFPITSQISDATFPAGGAADADKAICFAPDGLSLVAGPTITDIAGAAGNAATAVSAKDAAVLARDDAQDAQTAAEDARDDALANALAAALAANYHFGVVTSGTNNLIISVPTLTSLANNPRIAFIANADNNLPDMQINAAGLGLKAFTKFGALPMGLGNIKLNQLVFAQYDGTRWQNIGDNFLVNPVGSNGQFQVNNVGTLVGTAKMSYDTSTGQVTIGENSSAQGGYLGVHCGNQQYSYNVFLHETGHATSKRTGLACGAHWILLTDLNGDGTRNIGFYNSNIGNTPLQIDTGGRVTAPLQPLFLGSRTAGNVAGAADFVASNVVTNRGSHYNTTTGIFTCPVAGDYAISFVCGGGAAVQVAIQYNGSTVVANLSGNPGILSCVIAAAVNDQLKIRVLSGTVTANAANTNHLSIRLLT